MTAVAVHPPTTLVGIHEKHYPSPWICCKRTTVSRVNSDEYVDGLCRIMLDQCKCVRAPGILQDIRKIPGVVSITIEGDVTVRLSANVPFSTIDDAVHEVIKRHPARPW